MVVNKLLVETVENSNFLGKGDQSSSTGTTEVSEAVLHCVTK